MPYFHVVFTLPAQINAIAYQNKQKVYGILFRAAAETLCTIAADPKHLGAKIGVTSVLHSWGQNLQYHPHVHCIVPGGGISLDGTSWVSCKPGFFLPVRVLSRLFRRLFLHYLAKAFEAEKLKFFNDQSYLSNEDAFESYLEPLHKKEWVVYAKRPFTDPEQVLGYLARYTHRVAIANSRLVRMKGGLVDFKWKDYRLKGNNQHKVMRLPAHDFISRFLLHVLPDKFHRIRHHGLFANTHRAQKVELCRKLLSVLGVETPPEKTSDAENLKPVYDPKACLCCGGKMLVIISFEHQYSHPKYHSSTERFDGL